MTLDEAVRVFDRLNREGYTARWKTVLCLTLGAALLNVPLFARAISADTQSPEVPRVAVEFEGDSAQGAKDRAQQKSDTEKEARDREQEKKDQEQERLDRIQELYDDGRNYLDEESYGDAVNKFSELAALNGPQTDAALYWKAYAENKQGKREAALATTAELKHRFPQSRWKKDAEALEIEVKQRSGATVNPDTQSDDDLKFLALQGIINNDPERGIPLVTKYLNGPGSPKEKGKALFVLAQSGSPQAEDTLKKIALGQSNPELQRKAIEYLSIFVGKTSKATLQEVYTSTNDLAVKSAVIRGYMISGDRELLLALAKGEKNEALKREAIRNLGISGGRAELQQLYQSENSIEAKKEILQALFLSGDSQKLARVAQDEKNPELRRAAVRNMGLMGGREPELQSIYTKESDRGIKEEVLNAYFLGGNANGLIAVAKTEKDPELKKVAVQKLSLMGSKEANDYLMELLQK
jgi:HEAT repeats